MSGEKRDHSLPPSPTSGKTYETVSTAKTIEILSIERISGLTLNADFDSICSVFR